MHGWRGVSGRPICVKSGQKYIDVDYNKILSDKKTLKND